MAKGNKKLVGGNRGAWAHAKEQAKGKKNPEAYAAKVFANITKKSWEDSMDDDMADLLVKAEGSRGGHIIGHTSSGKPIYQGKNADHAKYKSFTKRDHADAMDVHDHLQQYHSKANRQAFMGTGNSDSPANKALRLIGREHSKAAASHENSAESHFHQNYPNMPRNKATPLTKTASDRTKAAANLFNQGNESMEKSAAAVLQDYLLKSQHGEGSRGGHIIGHTKSGKPIYANQHSSYTNRHGGLSVSSNGSGATHSGHANFSAQDHDDAAKHHRNLARFHEKQASKTAEDYLGEDPADVRDDQRRSWGMAEAHREEADEHLLAAHGMRNKQFFNGSHLEAAAKHGAASKKLYEKNKDLRVKMLYGDASPTEKKAYEKVYSQRKYHDDLKDMHMGKAKSGA